MKAGYPIPYIRELRVNDVSRFEVCIKYPKRRALTLLRTSSWPEARWHRDWMQTSPAGDDFIIRASLPKVDFWNVEDVPGGKLAVVNIADRTTLLVPFDAGYADDTEAFAARHWQAFTKRMNWDARQ
jgi:hypothetical protein